MAAIKPLADSSAKWSRRAGEAVTDFVNGVRNPRRSWKGAAREAGDNYKASVVAAANEGRYVRGVERSSDESWAQMSEAKGQTRYPEGVSLGQGDWEKGFSPYQEAIARLVLEKRGTRSSQANYGRSAAVGRALSAVRMRMLAGS